MARYFVLEMKIHVRLAEPFWRAVGQRDLDIELADGAQVAGLLAALKARYPALEQEFDEAPPTIFVNEEEADVNTLLTDGSRVHFVWPIAGGCVMSARQILPEAHELGGIQPISASGRVNDYVLSNE